MGSRGVVTAKTSEMDEAESIGAAPVAGLAVNPSDASDPDDEVVQAVAASDLLRATRLCAAQHGAAIGRFCMAMLGSQADAEDVAQETLIDAYRALGSWRQEGSLRGYLFTIARRKCARLIERRKQRAAKLRLVSGGEVEAAASEQQLLLKERAEQARQAMATIRPSEREALLLRFGSDMSFREVAQVCGIDEAAARKRVSRGVAALRSQLSERGDQP